MKQLLMLQFSNLIKNIKRFFVKRNVDIKIKKVNKQEVLGSLAKRSQADYYGFYNGIYFDFEAKQTIHNFFDLNQIKKHQWEHLELIANNKGIAFILVAFVSVQAYYGVRFEQILAYCKTYKKKRIPITWFVKNAISLQLILPGLFDFQHLITQLIS